MKFHFTMHRWHVAAEVNSGPHKWNTGCGKVMKRFTNQFRRNVNSSVRPWVVAREFRWGFWGVTLHPVPPMGKKKRRAPPTTTLLPLKLMHLVTECEWKESALLPFFGMPRCHDRLNNTPSKRILNPLHTMMATL